MQLIERTIIHHLSENFQEHTFFAREYKPSHNIKSKEIFDQSCNLNWEKNHIIVKEFFIKCIAHRSYLLGGLIWKIDSQIRKEDPHYGIDSGHLIGWLVYGGIRILL